MKFLGNLLWFILLGWWMGLAYLISGVILCITIIGIPFGIACFRLAKLVFLPFGKEVATDYEAHPVGNVLWLVCEGSSAAVGCAVLGAILCVTIIGIPFGLQFFKLMKLSAFPFGAEVG